MTFLSGPLGFYTVTSRLVVAVTDALQLAGNPVQRAGVVPNAIVWDECDCGALYGSVLGRMYQSNNFPQPLAETGDPCEASWLVADLTLQVMRCAPTPSGDALAPSVAALDASAQEVSADAWYLLRTATCTLQTMRDDTREVVDFLVRQLTPAGPQGGCVGSELIVTVALPRGIL